MYIPSDPKLWEKIFRDKTIRQSKFWLPWLGIVLITFGLPEESIKASQLAGELTRIMASLVPSIPKWIERSSFPATTGLLLALYWIALPYYFLIYLSMSKSSCNDRRFVDHWLKAGPKRHLYPLLLLSMSLMFFLPYYQFALPEAPNCTRLCIHESLLLQIVYGFCMVVANAGLAATVFVWIKNFKKIHFSTINLGDKQ